MSIVEDMQSITLTILVLPWWIRVFLFLLVYLLTQRILYRLIGRYATSLTISFVVATASIYLFIQDTSVWFVMYSIPLPFYLLVTNFVRVDTSLSVLGQNKDRANIHGIMLTDVQTSWQFNALVGLVCGPLVFELFHFICRSRSSHPVLFWFMLVLNVIMVLQSSSLLFWNRILLSKIKAPSGEGSQRQHFELMTEFNESLMDKFSQEERFWTTVEKRFGNIKSLADDPERFRDYIRFSKSRIEDLLKSEKYQEAFDRLEMRKAAIWHQIFATHELEELDYLSEKKQKRFSAIAKDLRLLWAHAIDNLSAKRAKIKWTRIEEQEKEIRKQVKIFSFTNEMLHKLMTSQALTFGDIRDIITATDTEYNSTHHKEAVELLRHILQTRRVFTPMSIGNLPLELSCFFCTL